MNAIAFNSIAQYNHIEIRDGRRPTVLHRQADGKCQRGAQDSAIDLLQFRVMQHEQRSTPVSINSSCFSAG